MEPNDPLSARVMTAIGIGAVLLVILIGGFTAMHQEKLAAVPAQRLTAQADSTAAPVPPPPPPAPISTKLTVGGQAQVFTFDGVQVYSGALNSTTLLGTEPIFAIGTVVGGPIASGGSIWWKISWNGSPIGWSIEDNLIKHTPGPGGNLVTVNLTNPSGGRITTSPVGIDCGFNAAAGSTGSTCTTILQGNSVTFTAVPNNGFAVSWSGCGATVSGNTCTMAMTSSVTIGVNFVDSQAPTISISSPTDASTVSGTVVIAANATDNLAVSSVEFRIGGAHVGTTISAAPFSIPWNTTAVANGNYTIVAVATDVAGNATVSNSVTVIVSNAASNPGNTTGNPGGTAPNTPAANPAANSPGSPGGLSGGLNAANAPAANLQNPNCVNAASAIPASALALLPGSRGQSVSDLQSFLVLKGYLDRQYITGYYGSLTKGALDLYKAANPGTNCSTASTAASASTSTAGSINCPPGLICTPNAASTVASGSLPAFTRTLKLGMTGADVKNLQIFLNSHGFLVASSGLGSKGNETTYFGPATFSALIRFQNTNAATILIPNGLSSGTGFFGSATMGAVNGMLNR